ncbi:serine/threonine protein kinase, partial [Streptomyces galbus]|nr:serine/threonine protein kinase [Streptomyces galbus]
PQPQRPQRPAPEPREPRRRSANPMRIPGLGCLKGCLFTLVILLVAGWMVWEFTPLQDWIGTGKGYWQQLGDWIDTVTTWIGDLGSSGSSQ